MGALNSISSLNWGNVSSCWDNTTETQENNTGHISEFRNESRIKPGLSSRRSNNLPEGQNVNCNEELKEPSGVKVQENSHRNLERGGGREISIGKLCSKEEKDKDEDV